MQKRSDTYLIHKKQHPGFFITFAPKTGIYHENDSAFRRLLAAFAAQRGRPCDFRRHRHPARTPRTLAPVRGGDAPRGANTGGRRRDAERHGKPGLHDPERRCVRRTDRLQIGGQHDAHHRNRLLAPQRVSGPGDHDVRRAGALPARFRRDGHGTHRNTLRTGQLP